MLTHELADEFLSVIPKTMRSIRRELRKLAAENLSLTEFRVLANLFQKIQTNGEIAEEIGISVPAMTRLIDGLVESGLVIRTYPDSDRRKTHLKLTEQGEKTFQNLRQRAAEHFAESFEGLSSEKLKRLLGGLAVLNEIASKRQNL